ncbi:hypothetical protein ES703_71751 [subsurface metagenome]
MKNVGIDKPFELESIYLEYEKATLPGMGIVYGTACARATGAIGTNFPAWGFLFDMTAEEGNWWPFCLPRNFLKQHQVKVKVYWMAVAAVAGGVVWGVKLLGRKEGEVWDAPLGAEVMAAGTVQDVAGELTVTEITIPAATHLLEEKDTVMLQLARKVGEDDDDLAEDAKVVMVDFEFARDPNILVA